VSTNYPRETNSRIQRAIGEPTAAFPPQPGTLTYEPYFGLKEKPFSLNADSRFVYDSASYLATKEGVLAGIRRREGVLVLTGQIGTGKTTLCRAVLGQLGGEIFSSLVLDPFASREDLLKMLLIDFGVLSIQKLTAASLRQASRTELSYLLADFLNSVAPEAFVVVIIDEAQNLSVPLIEETRLLCDTFGSQGRLQLVFVGQPELHAKLKLPEMRQVDQRICGYYRLPPLTRDAAAGYIQHRLEVAGSLPDRVLFPPEIIDSLYARSGGVPRLINRVCDRALQLTYERRADAVDRELLDTALIEVGSVTLSPTWDSIVFADPPAIPRAVPAPTVAPVPTPAAPALAAETNTSATNADTVVVLNLTPAALTSAFAEFPTEASLAIGTERVPRPTAVRPSAPRPAAKRDLPPRNVRTERPRSVLPEIGMQRSKPVLVKQAATALAILALVAAMAGATFLPGALTAPALPEPPKAPVLATPGLALLPATAAEALAAAAIVSVSTPAPDRLLGEMRDRSPR
jgi:type II secretory pathway predicted ATPase ExeA